MKRILLVLLVVISTVSMYAKDVDQSKAKQVARNFAVQRDRRANQLQLDVVYSHPMPNTRDAAFYVVNLGETGFVIVSANDVAHPVIGYSFDRPWPTEGNIPPQITDYLDDLAGQIEAASTQTPDRGISSEWQELMAINPNNPPQPKGNRTEVGPLLTTTWDQGQYYNAMCPEDANGPDGHALTGCVATAMAQIINYHQYPQQGRGRHSYDTEFFGYPYGILSVDYENETYDYTNMSDALTDGSTDVQINAVAQLIRDCGVAVNMQYSAGESGAYDQDARGALINFFRYSPDLSFAHKSYYTAEEWRAMLRNDLDAGDPIYYSGQGTGGHAFVCDGYNSENYFSFNFGWSGFCDGWYLLDAVYPGGMDFNNTQGAIMGIVPDINGNIIIGQTLGDSYFDIEEPMEFYSSMGHNRYLSMYYSNSCFNRVVFAFTDNTKTGVVDIIKYENQTISFYDSEEGNPYILNSTSYNINTIYSTSNVVSLYYEGYINSKGFGLYVRTDDDCGVPAIVITRDTTSINVVNYSYEAPMSWQIEYGLEGFEPGEGAMINVESSTVTIDNLTKYTTYDIYARTTCGANQYSPWVKQTMLLDPYWTDIVIEQPAGYIENPDGNVEISSAEGLAWLSVLVNGFHGNQPCSFEGKTVTLTSDINLAGYRWYPMGRYLNWDWTEFSGTFDGQGHAISNIYVRDASSNLGFFGRVKKGRVRNVNLVGGSVSCTLEPVGDDPQFWLPSSTIGGLAGETRDCYEITNCHSSVDVSGNGGAGSLCGYIWAYEENIQTIISNSSASGTVSGREVCGGLIGGVYGKVEIRNCYATGDVLITTCDFDAWEMGRGGLLGSFRQNASIYNCFSTGIVYYDSYYNHPKGNTIGYVDQRAHIQYVYGRDDVNQELDMFGSCSASSETYISDTSHFHHNGNTNVLLTPVSIDGAEQTELLDALNAWVTLKNDQNNRTWVIDYSTGFPVFGDNFEPSCYNPSDVIVTNATIVGDTTIRTQLSWTQIGESDHWEILYVATEHDISEGMVVSADSNPCVLTNIPVGHPLDFYIRSVCGDNDYSGWSSPITYIPDKLRWTEVVTSQPEGYNVDAQGNVYVSTAEGLAWLSSVSNGLNGVQFNEFGFVGKNIEIMEDIDLSDYRWISIASSWTTVLRGCDINGNNHIITGLYCNELEDYQGLFGCVTGGTISDLTLNQCNVYGENRSGGLVGEAYVDIKNCSVSGNVYGIDYVGGVVGWYQDGNIVNSSFVGDVTARHDVTKESTMVGYVGGICGVPLNDSIINCYVVSEIADTFAYSGIITGTGGQPNIVSNCYYKNYETTLPITSDNCTVTDNSSFSGSGTTWTLNTPPYVNGEFRTDLLDALNAWVDANNTNGEYLHWVADTANQNGGFPMLEQLPSTTTQSQTLSQGWNWWSTYIVQEGTNGMIQLKSTLGENGIQIKSQTASTQYLPNGSWFGTLTTLENEKSYRVNVSGGVTTELSGTPVDPTEHPITLQPNWTWIGYPVNSTQSVTSAMSGFTPQTGDVIKSQGSSSFYTGAGWFPAMNMVPGQGYLYKSSATENRTLTFTQGRGEVQNKDEYQRHWDNDIHAFADNMTVLAVVRENGEELVGNGYELGAFVNGESRGSVRLEYCEPLDRYVAVLTVSGEDVDRITFGLFDRATEKESYDSSNAITFSSNAVLGELNKPYEIGFGSEGTTGLSLFPNPVGKNEEVGLELPSDVKVVEAVVTDMLGRVIRHEAIQANRIAGMSESGVYNVQVVTDKGIYHGKLIVK